MGRNLGRRLKGKIRKNEENTRVFSDNMPAKQERREIKPPMTHWGQKRAVRGKEVSTLREAKNEEIGRRKGRRGGQHQGIEGRLNGAEAMDVEENVEPKIRRKGKKEPSAKRV